MGTNLDITIDEFLTKLKINEITYILALQCTLCKPTFFSNTNQMIYGTNVFSINGGPLWEANINAQFILNPYVVAAYCTPYLTKVDNFNTCEM
jgi:hypothetical protein